MLQGKYNAYSKVCYYSVKVISPLGSGLVLDVSAQKTQLLRSDHETVPWDTA
jgi:hypothetical protein